MRSPVHCAGAAPDRLLHSVIGATDIAHDRAARPRGGAARKRLDRVSAILLDPARRRRRRGAAPALPRRPRSLGRLGPHARGRHADGSRMPCGMCTRRSRRIDQGLRTLAASADERDRRRARRPAPPARAAGRCSPHERTTSTSAPAGSSPSTPRPSAPWRTASTRSRATPRRRRAPSPGRPGARSDAGSTSYQTAGTSARAPTPQPWSAANSRPHSARRRMSTRSWS